MNPESSPWRDPSREILPTQQAISRLGTRFDKYGNYYWGLAKALNAYLREEYELELPDARDYIKGLEQVGMLPSQERYVIGDERLLHDYRLAVYEHFMPLYRDTHEAADFELWLPAALDVVFPLGDLHASGECRPYGEEAVDYPGLACRAAQTCSRRLVLADVLRGGAFIGREYADMRESELLVRDPWRVYGDSQALVRALADRGIFDDTGTLIATMRLQEKMHEVFGIRVDE